MPRYVYINGRYCDYHNARISIEDRGFQWGDSVYVVFAYVDGRFIDMDQHLLKLQSYALAIDIKLPFCTKIFPSLCLDLIHRNHLKDAFIYIQLTRGHAQRVHWFPKQPCAPSLVIIARPFKSMLDPQKLDEICVVTQPDIRWRRSNIKTNAALANVLLRQHAISHGCYEAWLENSQGMIVEGASSNAYIVNDTGDILTHPDDGSIVAGVTRNRLLQLARSQGLKVLERAFDLDEAYQAREAFITGSISMIKAVTRINDQTVGQGTAGPVTQRLAQMYVDYCQGKALTSSH